MQPTRIVGSYNIHWTYITVLHSNKLLPVELHAALDQ